ncbi:family 43 glycosylhydrolase [Niabella drilacis]|uniref:BNR repeat-like domain-containing protein n=1 Tax=Niabella drilacis (strain DSM 25811 / CCM 8410 / CCUG 62505 / LMG 26954 / E90) TaxID=1285928 RepID=A0A1G6TYD4_NIADE|nr:family 43 glycosylhydrolase [Niabella drilacis]SDD33944.1 BNR repeat-like domain-containing protein [Niabella drilacis]
MKKLLCFLILPAALQLSAQSPAIATDFPDPTVITAGGKYYAYATNSGPAAKFMNIQVAVSDNLKDWRIIGDALPEKPSWGYRDFWAPHVLYQEQLKKYVLFYSAETVDTSAGKAIGVAFADRPEGPFRDSGSPLIVGPGFEAIDPMVIRDPRSGKYYMVWGSGFRPLQIREMDPSMTAFAKDAETYAVLPAGADKDYGRLVEGAWIDYRNGYYYLYYSGDNCCGVEAHYAVMVARAKNITGPYIRRGAVAANKSSVILERDAMMVAPGHNSVIEDRNGKTWIAYHAIPRAAYDRKNYGRMLYLDRVEYRNGWPVVVKEMPPAIAVRWTDSVTISAGYRQTAAGEKLPVYGAQYPRLLKLSTGKWLAGYTVLRNRGYKKDAHGGLELEISESSDNGKNWKPISTIADPGRDLDNAQLVQLPGGDVLLAGRSVRWQESYRLPVYKSSDGGKSWQFLSIIDANEGAPGTLGTPDKGMYEPHFYFLNDGRLAVMYATEKHVTESPSYSQVIAQRISPDAGKTWGKETWVAHTPGHPQSRPGMPVVDRMLNGSYIVVYEVCGPEDCGIYYKTSADGINWKEGLGTFIPGHQGAPYVLALPNGNLLLSSNRGTVSVSRDFGRTWKEQDMPWRHSAPFEADWHQTIWQSIYLFGNDTIGIVTSRKNAPAGHAVKIRFGRIEKAR